MTAPGRPPGVSDPIWQASRYFSRGRWIPTMDIGRSLAGLDAADADTRSRALALALETELLPLLQSHPWKLTIFCGAAAMSSPVLVKALGALPDVSLGVRRFAEEWEGPVAGRDEQIRSLAESFGAAFGTRRKLFRGESADVDVELGPQLARAGFTIDASACPNISEADALPLSPWHAGSGNDVTRVGKDPIWCVPTFVHPGGNFGRLERDFAQAWDLGDEDAALDLDYFLEFLADVSMRMGKDVPFVTTIDGDLLAGHRAAGITEFLNMMIPLAHHRSCPVDLMDGDHHAAAEKWRLSCVVPATRPRPTPPIDASLSFCVITNGARPDALRRLVSSIEAQNIPNYEIIVAGRPPEDERTVPVHCPEAADQGILGRMRNAGVAAAKGDWIVILDDDFLLPENWYESFRALRPEAHVLSSEVRLPDGGRYWDHTTVDGPRGHAMINPGAEDLFSYVTGGGGWLLSRQASEAVTWDESLQFYEAEDVEFSRRLQAEGFAIAAAPGLVCIHGDDRYSTCGRTVTMRREADSAHWVIDRFGSAYLHEFIRAVVPMVEAGENPEAWDLVRYGCLKFPKDPTLKQMRRILEFRNGGPLEGTRYDPEGDELWHATLSFVARHELSRVLIQGVSA